MFQLSVMYMSDETVNEATGESKPGPFCHFRIKPAVKATPENIRLAGPKKGMPHVPDDEKVLRSTVGGKFSIIMILNMY